VGIAPAGGPFHWRLLRGQATAGGGTLQDVEECLALVPRAEESYHTLLRMYRNRQNRKASRPAGPEPCRTIHGN
jgi:hypothetical protein